MAIRGGGANPIFTKYYTADVTYTLSSGNSLTHGLGEKPKLVLILIRCITADLGYSVGDEILVDSRATGQGVSATADNTTIYARIGSNALEVTNKSTGNVGTVTTARWVVVVRAWA